MSLILDKPDRWRKRAEEARTIAETLAVPEAKRMMLDLAESYELLAKRSEERAHRQTSSEVTAGSRRPSIP
jgi:hypothetical protein